MTFVFWQGIISIHQRTFLEAVAAQAGVDKVVLVVEQDITASRMKMGWEVPQVAGVTVVRAPKVDEVKLLAKTYRDAVHVMGGIRVGAMLSAAFDACVSEGCRIGIMTEPYNSAGLKGTLRTLKYQYYRLRYFRHIQFVLGIGRQGVEQYMGLGFDAARIFPWAYFVSVPMEARKERPKGTQRIIYAGRLEAAKGIYRFVAELVESKRDNYELDIYGEGPDDIKIMELVKQKGLLERIRMYPFLKYEELLKQYAHYDWVVLPSAAKDGWGVIVSEGMLNGLKAICSDICGVSRVVKDGVNGVTFDWATEGSCRKAINRMLAEQGFAAHGTIAAWAAKGISAAAGARYFMRIIGNVYNNEQRPGIPWEEA